jgi:signal transduction histidine kinase/ActR/RegA family two-component response regulator
MTTPLLARLKTLLFALAAGCAGFALNRFELPVFGGTSLVFGGVASLLSAFFLGPVFGGITAAVAFAQTWIAWQHPAGFVCYTLEAVAVGWLVQHRRFGLLPATALYWLLCGVPLTVGFLTWVDAAPFPANWALAIKYPLNGLLAAAFVLPIGNSDPFRRWLNLPALDESRTPLQRALFRRFGIIAVLPPLLLILLLGQWFDRTLRASAEKALTDDARDIGAEIEAYVFDHQRDLVTLARQLRLSNLRDPADFAPRLEILRQQYSGFLTLFIADAGGEVVGNAPTVDARGAPFVIRGLNVADRDYFREPMGDGRPYVSGVFRGRDLGHDLIVALSVPILGPDDRPQFLLEGSLNLKALIEKLRMRDRVHDRDLVIADHAGKVVLTAGRVEIPPLADFGSRVAFRPLADLDGAALLDRYAPGHSRPERHVAVSSATPALRWRVVLLEPIWLTQRRVALFYALSGLASLLVIALALLLARSTAAEITEPLQRLVRRTQALARRETAPAEPEISYPSGELTTISRELENSARTLIESNAQLAGAIVDRNKSHRDLRLILKTLDERVRDRTSQLEAASKAAESANQAKSEFLASMSHELRTTLNVIIGMTEVLREQTLGQLNPEQLDAIASVEESGRHLLSLINDILDLSKIEAGMLELDLQENSVRDICESSLRFVRESALKNRLTLTAVYGQTATHLFADGRRLKQILVNLLSNAVKFTPAGGRVELTVNTGADATRMIFSVQDTGIGIAPEQQSKLFRAFQQIDSALNRKYAGTGLGLALVKRLAEMQGGEVSVTSEPGAGSRFVVSLPVTRPEAELEAAKRALTVHPFGPVRFPGEPLVLIAEDHPTNRLVLQHHLRPRGCRLAFAGTGQEAIELAHAERPAIVLMDVQMPVLDGLEATRRLRADPATASLPIIALTALATPEDRIKCLEAGADAYLSKPLNLAELDRLIIEQLTRDARADPASHHAQHR